MIINVKNEEDFIGDCLESVKWADEIVLVLSEESTDKTGEIAKNFGVKIIKQEQREMDFAAWHNQGMREARGEWLLWVDADERIPPLLKEEIKSSIINHKQSLLLRNRSSIVAYAIPRRNFLLGKELKHGGWFPDYQIRLFKKNKLKGWIGRLHEHAEIEGEVGKLENPMIHLQPETIEPALKKSIRWSEIEAKLLLEANHPKVSWWRVLRMVGTTLFDRLIKKRGFLDGTEGWIESFYQAFHTMIIYIRLWEIQEGK